MIEQTLSIVKPDAVERNLENKIKSFFEEKISSKSNKKIKKRIVLIFLMEFQIIIKKKWQNLELKQEKYQIH